MRKLSMDELHRIDLSSFKTAEKIPLVLVLDNVRSLHNIGSIFRTSDAFRVQSLFLCGITATPPHREIHKTALGAEESVDWRYFSSIHEAIENLLQANFSVYALEQTEHSTSLLDFKPIYGPTAIILGNEIDGVNQEILPLLHGAVEIPQFGTKHSLNVSVASGIFTWQIFSHWSQDFIQPSLSSQ